MNFNKAFLAAALALPLALSACVGEGGTFELELLDKDCTGEVNFLPGSANLIVSITGDGIGQPITKTYPSAGSDGSAELPEVPYGSNRVVKVRAEAGGRLVATGVSRPFDLSESDSPTVTVLLQGVNRFTGAADAANECVTMTTERAGHTSVRMDDGRVLLVGGFRKLESAAGVDYIAGAEIYDPAKGTFRAASAPCDGQVCYDAAKGQGVVLKDKRVLVIGGETTVNKAPSSVATAMIYDPKSDRWTATALLEARRGHTAHVLKSGRVLVIGGMDEAGNVLESTEFFDPASSEFKPGPSMTAVAEQVGAGRAFHSSVLLNETTVMVAAGMHAGGTLAARAIYLQEQANGTIDYRVQSTGVARLATPVMLPGAGVVKGKMVVVGGATGYNAGNGRTEGATDRAQWLDASRTTDPTRDSLATRLARVAPCVAPLDANRLLVAGGFNASGNPLDGAELLAWNDEKQIVERSPVGDSEIYSKMSAARGHAACTNLGDGRILVTGGVGAAGAGSATSAAEIYVIREL